MEGGVMFNEQAKKFIFFLIILEENVKSCTFAYTFS